MKLATLAVIEKDGKLLMGYKKRGFAKGILNGPGGKKNINESFEQCLVRETKEELGITLKDPKLAAILEFFFNGDEDWLVFVYYVSDFSGEVLETDELKPIWIDKDNIPYDELWQDDYYWLPEVLKGNFVKGTFYYDNDSLTSHELEIIGKRTN